MEDDNEIEENRVQVNASISPNLLGVAEVLREFNKDEGENEETNWTPPKAAGLGNADAILDLDGANEVGQIMADLDDEEDQEEFSLEQLQGGVDANLLAFFGGRKGAAACQPAPDLSVDDKPNQLAGIFQSKPGEWKPPTQSGLSHSERLF